MTLVLKEGSRLAEGGRYTSKGFIYSYGEEGTTDTTTKIFNTFYRQYCDVRVRTGAMLLFENFRCLYSYYGPSSPKEYIHP